MWEAQPPPPAPSAKTVSVRPCFYYDGYAAMVEVVGWMGGGRGEGGAAGDFWGAAVCACVRVRALVVVMVVVLWVSW